MLNVIPPLLGPFLVLAVVLFLIFRLGFFSSREIGGRYTFLFGGLLIFLAVFWQAVKAIPEYGEWFIPSAYPVVDLVQFGVLVIGVLMSVIGLALYADYWQGQREEIETRQGKLSILENLQHDARQPYHLLELLNMSLREILVHLPCSGGAVFLLNRSRRQFVLTSFSGLTKKETALLEYYPMERNVLSQAVDLGDPALMSSFDFIDRNSQTIRSRFHSCLVLPLTSGMEKIGVLVMFAEERQFFSRSDIRYLNPVAQWLAEKIRSARLSRQLNQTNATVEKHTTDLAAVMTRFGAAAKAMTATDRVTMFCRSLGGMIDSESVHLCGLKQGGLVFHGGSEPLFDLSEHYKTALIDAIDRGKPLIINQEATDENNRQSVVLSSLVYPLALRTGQDALLFIRGGRPFEVSERDLRELEILAGLAGQVILYGEYQRLALTRRRGFDAVLNFLKADQGGASLADSPAYFLRQLISVLPEGAVGLSLVRNERGALKAVEVAGTDERLPDDDLEILAGEGGIGKAAATREGQFVFGRGNVARHMEQYEQTSRGLLNRFFGERGLPIFLACCPILTGQTVAGVVMFGLYDLDESERGEWERLLTLAAGLYSLRLTIDDMQTVRAAVPTETVDAHRVGPLINGINNHLSAVVGTAELASRRSDLSGETTAQLKQIVHEAEQAAAIVKKALVDRPLSEESPVSSQPVVTDGLSRVIKGVLQQSHVSGDLYMAGQRPHEIRLRLEKTPPVDLPSERMRHFFESVLNRFASLAEDDDTITVTVYAQNDFVFIDLCRHRREFPPVEKVAEFGEYHLSGEVFRMRPGDIYLRHLEGAPSYYAVDGEASSPAYLSFKLPIRRSEVSGRETPAESSIIRVLAIDDQPVILDLIVAMGQSLGYRVATAGSGHDGIILAEQERFDVILTDLALPDLSGFEVAVRLRRLQPDTPIILVTGWKADLDASRLASSGISQVLYKPFRIEQLTDVVQGAVADFRKK